MRRKTQRLNEKPQKYALDIEKAVKFFNDSNKESIEKGEIMPLSKGSFNDILGLTAKTLSTYDYKESRILTTLMYVSDKTGLEVEKIIKKI